MGLAKSVSGWILLVLGCIWTGSALALAFFAGFARSWLFALQFFIAASFFLISILVIYGGWRMLKGQSPERHETLIITVVVFIALAMIIMAVTYSFTDNKRDLEIPEFNPRAITELFAFSRSDVYVDEIPYVKASGSDVRLVNYKNATDPSWAELIAFLQRDATDERLYEEDVFACADFAELLHNNAEAAGIKAAYVGVDFVVGAGHALNAFNTTDKGLVYVDCTSGFSSPVVAELTDSGDGSEACAHDKIAYVLEGNEYGVISMDKAASLEYRFYEEYEQNWAALESDREAYNSDVATYNADAKAYEADVDAYEKAVGGRTYISDPDEYQRLTEMYNALKAQEAELERRGNELTARRELLDERQEAMGGCRWKPLGVVTGVEIYW